MGQWIGKGKFVFSSQEKAEFARKKREEFQAQIDEDRKKYLTQSNLKSFLTTKQFEEHFKSSDKSIRLKHGGWMHQYEYKKVLSKVKRLKLHIEKIKKGFEDIRIEEVKQAIREHNALMLVNKLDKKLPPKGITSKKLKI